MLPDHERIDTGKYAAIPGPHIELGHGVDTRRVAAGIDIISHHNEQEIAIHPMLVRIARMHDQAAVHAHDHLHHFIRMRVIHEGARFGHYKFVDESFSGFDLWLIQTTHAVHAIRHTPRGGAVTVNMGCRYPGNIFVSVENPGKPIPPEHLSRLFDRFYRVDPSRQRVSEGAGLGLAITRSIVLSHGGKVQVSSDQTTRFEIRLPASVATTQLPRA